MVTRTFTHQEELSSNHAPLAQWARTVAQCDVMRTNENIEETPFLFYLQ